eukprot:CAMPEP_0178434254 /NCGR_PEP_ID=MMETSP0689_2-20121128/33329_1 /TAXON_ID=160604 /ORGANISM="Amphidinium massartii, Strain CS-259" /LENGTH=538 /DNA_ID=CAMNT_0020056313 /DNA_START=20 /DNA_END=1636 /DNA_ORIENTATION=+
MTDVATTLTGVLWLLLMFYIMLFCQHRICEAYFVPSLNVLMDKMGNSENVWLKRLGNPGVAGATFMALGANGPELFTNLFSQFSHSDGGIGVVIGSEIFNLLIIIGASVVATKQLPLRLETVPFVRDVLFYAFSIALLLWALADQAVEKYEAGVMLLAGLFYWACVYFTEDVASNVFGIKAEVVEAKGGSQTQVHGVKVEVEEVYHARMADGHGRKKTQYGLDAEDVGIIAEPVEEKKRDGGKPERASVGFAVDKEGALMGAVMMYKDLSEVVVVGEGVIELTFQKSMFEKVSLKVKAESGVKRDELLESLRIHSNRTWIHNYDPTCKAAIDIMKHHVKDAKSISGKIYAVLEFFVDFVLRLTLFWCDVKDIKKEKYWVACFVGAMLWLAFFSYSMVFVMGQITACIPALSSMLLGVTIGAIGTSLPNAMGSIIMASQGKSAAAIGNAFGSNVQNVFLAMAGPWMIYMCVSGDKDVPQPPPEKGQSISEGVMWMLGTLILVVFFAILPETCTFSKAYGYVFISVYVIYLIWTVFEFES